VREYMSEGGDTLDIGCGAGQNTAMLGRYSRSVVGVDNDRLAIEFARKHNGMTGAEFVLGDFPGAIGKDRLFHHAFMIETIEHVQHNKQFDFIDEALCRLHDGGLLFITTPNEQTSSPPHVGIWSDGWMQQVRERFATQIVREGFFCSAESGLGFIKNASTHRALVMKR